MEINEERIVGGIIPDIIKFLLCTPNTVKKLKLSKPGCDDLQLKNIKLASTEHSDRRM